MLAEKDFSELIRRTLLGGVFLSLALLASGLVLSLAGAGGQGALRAGLLALLLTPAARVAMLAYGYWRRGERWFALASLMVLALLGISLLA